MIEIQYFSSKYIYVNRISQFFISLKKKNYSKSKLAYNHSYYE